MRRRTFSGALILMSILVLAAVPVAGEEPPSGGAWLGVMLAGPQATGGGSTGSGVPISGIVEDGPAERAGLRSRDVIIAVAGGPVSDRGELIARVREQEPGSWIPLTVERRGEQLELRAQLTARPKETAGLRVRRGWVGVQAIDLPPSLREHFGAPAEAGVMVAMVDPGSPGEAAGFELGDVVFELDGEPLRSADELKVRLAGAGVGNKAEFMVLRSGAEMVLEAVVEAVPTQRAAPVK